MNIVEISNLRKVYNGNVCALNSISISIKNGDFFALLGKNGAGKSTTIGILISLIIKTSGSVYIHGYSLDNNSILIRSFIGFVPQEYNFNQFETVLDIILNQAGFYGISRSLAYNRTKELLIFFELWDKRNVASMKLSGGMKRRLMIVRALIHRPSILILDEPTAGVDILSRRIIWKFLQDLNKRGVTIILTTHYLEEVEYLCKNVAIIDNGDILIVSPVIELLNKITNKTLLLDIDSSTMNKYILDYKYYKFNMINDNILEVVISKGQTLTKLFSLLSRYKICVYNIRNKHNKLEELFIDLVS